MDPSHFRAGMARAGLRGFSGPRSLGCIARDSKG